MVIGSAFKVRREEDASIDKCKPYEHDKQDAHQDCGRVRIQEAVWGKIRQGAGK